MLAGKPVSLLLLLLAVGPLGLGCQTGPNRPIAQTHPRPAPSPDHQSPEGSVRAAPPLRITDPPAAVPTATPSTGLPTLPDLPSPGGIVPAAAVSPAPAESDLRRLHRLAAEDYARIDGYYVRLTRREQVNGKDQPKEVIRLSFRKEPWSVHFAWLEGEAKGREVVYVKGRYDNKLYTRLGPTDSHLLGDRIALPLDSPLVRNSSRHSITDAGAGSLIDRFGCLVAANEKGDRRRGTLTYRGLQKRPEFVTPVETAEQVIPPGADKDLPRGGRRLWMFNAAKDHLPALLLTTDDRAHEVEYYLHDRYEYPIPFDDRDFDPNTLWGKK